ncbi:MAG TPA: hypothetical protein PKV20_16710, partial [Anaerolineae bacterium]|nr:hypothetical protein [Anaerolineae bacterium]
LVLVPVILQGPHFWRRYCKCTWCIGQLTSQFLARMEDILALYALPYDPRYPVICLDERPCFLIGEKVAPLVMQAGQVRKEHYAYEKNGSGTLFAAIEPLTGWRLAQVYDCRTMRSTHAFVKH